jgi:hypothetical protein
MPFFFGHYLGNTQLTFSAPLLFSSLAIPLIIELVGKAAATVWLQQTTAVDFPLNNL